LTSTISIADIQMLLSTVQNRNIEHCWYHHFESWYQQSQLLISKTIIVNISNFN